MADVTIKYKDNAIAEMSESGSKKLATSGTYCEGDITVEYVAKETGVPNVKRWDITVVDGDPGSAAGIYVVEGDSWLAENRTNPNLCVMILPKFTVASSSGVAAQGLWLCTNMPIITAASTVYKSLSAYIHRTDYVAARTRNRSLTDANNIGDLLITSGGKLMIMCASTHPVATGDYVVLAFIA